MLKFGDAEFASYMKRQHDRVAANFPLLQAEDGGDGKCRFVDLHRYSPMDARNLFWDVIHVNNDGNSTIGSAIASDLASSLLSTGTH